MIDRRPPTIVVLADSAGVLELVEPVVRAQTAHVLGTVDPLEALEVARRIKLDLVVSSRRHAEVTRDLMALQPGVKAFYFEDEPMSLAEIEAGITAALARLAA